MRHTVELFTRERGRVLVKLDSDGFLAAEDDAEAWAERQRPRLHVIEANALYPRFRVQGANRPAGTGPLSRPSSARRSAPGRSP
jgi:hypothetical protein